MVKQAPSLGRLLVMAGFALSCFGLLLFLWLAFGGAIPLKPKGYRMQIAFPEAGQLAQEADVRISGVPVGKVKTIETDKTRGVSDATIEIEERFAPIPADSRAILRQKTLLGETYVELTPGTRSGATVPENGRLARGQVSPTVELDEIFRAFDEPTRNAFRSWMAELATASRGRGRDISDALGNLAPFAQDTNTLLKILNAQEPTVARLIADTGEVFSALSERDGQLRSLVENANRVFETTAARDQELADTFRVLPTFERESIATVRRLERFARTTDPLITQLRPAARQLSPTLIDLAALSPDLKALLRDVDPLIDASEQGLPALERFLDQLRPLLGELDAPLRQLNPVLEFVGGYRSELTAFFANTVGATGAGTNDPRTGERVHYLRTTNPLNPENLAVYPRRVGSNRPNPYAFGSAFGNLAQGLLSFDTRHCANGVPTLVTQAPAAPAEPGATLPLLPGVAPVPLAPVPDPQALIPGPLADNVARFAFPGGAEGRVPAPPCRQQGPFTVAGETSQYPRVKDAPAGAGAAARSRGR